MIEDGGVARLPHVRDRLADSRRAPVARQKQPLRAVVDLRVHVRGVAHRAVLELDQTHRVLPRHEVVRVVALQPHSAVARPAGVASHRAHRALGLAAVRV